MYSSKQPLEQFKSDCSPCSLESHPDDLNVTTEPNSDAKTSEAPNCHESATVHFLTSTQTLTDLSATHLQSNMMSQNSELTNLPPSSAESTSSPASNHHYLYQIHRQGIHSVNRNPWPSPPSHIVSVGPDASSIVSASSSSNNGSNDIETVTTTTTATLHNRRFCCLWCHKIFTIAPDSDKRLARSYMSFIIGRFLGILSSVGLLIGLFVKFFSVSDSSFLSILAFVIIATSICVFSFSAILVIWATVYKSARAREKFLESTHPTPTATEPPFLKQEYKNKKTQQKPAKCKNQVDTTCDTNRKSTSSNTCDDKNMTNNDHSN